MTDPIEPTLTDRKAAILHAVVEGYIATSRPIGSGEVTRRGGVSVSSATVRKEMLALEEDGFLHQPHTSAGRVPTEKGYRYFVDALMEPYELGVHESGRVRDFFDQAHGELETLLDRTTSLLTGLTAQAAVVLGPSHESTTIRSVQVARLSESTALLLVVLADGAVDKHVVEVPESTLDSDLNQAAAVVAGALEGRAFGSMEVAAPPRGTAAADALVARFWSVLAADRHDAAGPLYVGGASRLAQSFDAVETVRQVLGVLEKQLVLISLVRDVVDRGLDVAIGTETGVEPLNECSIVVAPYIVDGEDAGSIAVLGPTRMNYPQALAAVAVVSRHLGSRLTEG